MSIVQLFNNLKNHTILRGSPSFSEDSDLEVLASLDFADKKKSKCSKGYPCGKSCIQSTKNCKNPIDGQAKTYTEWLKSQSLNTINKAVEPEPVTIVEPEPIPEIAVNLADFESIKNLGERLAEKYSKKIDYQEIETVSKLLQELDPEYDQLSEAIFAKNSLGIYGGDEYQNLQNRMNYLGLQRQTLVTRLEAAKGGIPLEDYQAFKDIEGKYNGAKFKVNLVRQGKSIALKNLSGQALEDERNKIFSDFMDKENEFFRKKREIDKDLTGLSDIYKDLVNAGGKSEADANTWLNSLGKRTAKVKKSDQAFKDVYQLTGGNIPTLKSVIYDKPRAYAHKGTGVVNVGKSETTAVIFHEVGHHLEFSNPEIKESANAFLQKRSTGQKQTLRKITGNMSFKADEVAVIDSFIDPYVGKIYKDGSTEVISMGLERFSTPEAMKEFRDKDPEHFHYILGVLAHVNNLKP